MRKLYCFVVVLLVGLNACTHTKKHGVSFDALKTQLAKGHPLFLVNGMELKDSLPSGGFMRLRAEDVADISVLKPTEAVKIFGLNGRKGVVLIKTNSSLQAK